MLLGGYAWVCGDYEAAADALALVDKKFTHEVVVQMLPFTGWNEQIIRECVENSPLENPALESSSVTVTASKEWSNG